MPLSATYVAQEPRRAEVDRMPGPVLLEFGTGWCGYCRALDADLAELLDRYPQVRHLRQVAADLGAEPPAGLGLEELLAWINGHSPTLRVAAPVSKRLACDDVGVGAMAGFAEVVATVQSVIR